MKLNIAAIAALAKGETDNFITASTPGGIEAQEAQGQRDLVNSSTLPIKHQGHEDRATLEAAGVVFGDNTDDLFCAVTLPSGWELKATDHSMWSDLLDDQKRVRASVFYKAAFYDRDAFYRANCRYSINSYHDGKDDSNYSVVIMDGNKVIRDFGDYPRSDYDECGKLEKQALNYMQKNFPDYKNAAAYWAN